LLVLIDESGDAGFKLARGSSPYFVVAMVIFDDFKEAEGASAIIETARATLRIKTEFKFNKCAA
jgi:spore maturation protein SpmB